MFLQVEVLEKDQPCLRFLWREDPSKNVEVYQYTRHIFGARDSPTCANFALQKTARDNITKYPDAVQAVFDIFYMDEYLDSVDRKEQAILRSRQLGEMLQLGGFKLIKFVSNVSGLLGELEDQSNDSQTKAFPTTPSP